VNKPYAVILLLGLCVAVQGCSEEKPAPPTAALEHQPVVVRVNAGAAEPLVDEPGSSWEADGGFWGGGVVNRGQIEIANTDIPSIYRTERWGHTEFRRPLPNGRYLVRLHFPETYPGEMRPGLRMADIDVSGTRLPQVDVLAETGGKFVAMVREASVSIEKGELLIRFASVPGGHHGVMINGIEIVPQDQ
jgi:hypothetical protein